MEAIETKTAEAIRQHQAWKAARDRLSPKPPAHIRTAISVRPAPVFNVPLSDGGGTLLKTGIYRVVVTGRFAVFDPAIWELCQRSAQITRIASNNQRLADFILALVIRETGISQIEIMGERKTANVVRARHLCFYLLYLHTGWSHPRIGRYVGGRDHTTCLHGVRKIIAALQSDSVLKEIEERLSNRVKFGRVEIGSRSLVKKWSTLSLSVEILKD